MGLRLRNPLRLLRSFSVALHAGSGQTRMATPQGEIILDEPTVIAQEGDGAVLAIGSEAKSFIGKAPERIRVIRPVQAGGVVEFEAARELFSRFLKKVLPAEGGRVQACVVVPQALTELERRTFADCCKAAGFGRVDLVRMPLAAAVGAGLDIRQAKGWLLLGIGSGLSEAALISLGDIVLHDASPVGADSFREAVAQFLAQTQHLVVGENMAEQVAMHLAWAGEPDAPRSMTVNGKLAASGTPSAVDLTSVDLAGALDAPLAELEALVRRVIEKAPAELVADLPDTGLILYGGGALLPGLDGWFSARLGLRVRIAQDPALCAVRGAASALREDLDFRKLLVRPA